MDEVIELDNPEYELHVTFRPEPLHVYLVPIEAEKSVEVIAEFHDMFGDAVTFTLTDEVTRD